MESSIKIEGLKLDFLLYRKRGMTFKEWFVGQFNKKTRSIKKNEVFTALRGINLEVKQGERLGIIGPNGAGKTTLLKCIAGIYEPSEGTVTVQGSITPLIDISAGFNPELSGRDNIYLHGAIRGMTRAEIRLREEEIVDFADIDGFIDVPTKYYSSGMMSRLAFSMATSIDPEILILDEVFAPGDAGFVKKARTRIHEIIDAAHIMLFVSHNQAHIRELCTRAIWLDGGKIIADGEPDEVLKYYDAGARLSSAKELFFLRNFDPKSYSTLRDVVVLERGDSDTEGPKDLRSRGVLKKGDLEKPLLSVIVLSQNGKDLDRCIRSVLIQPYDNIELIVVDTEAEQKTESIARAYKEAVDLWHSIKQVTLEETIGAGLRAANGSVVHVLFCADALADDAYTTELIRKVADQRVPFLLDYSLIRENGTIHSPSLPLLCPVLFRALLVPKSIYDQIGFQSVNDLLASLIEEQRYFGIPSGSAGVYLEEPSKSLLTETAEYWAGGMPTGVRLQLMEDLRKGCDSEVFWRVSREKREIILGQLASTFTRYVYSLPDKAQPLEQNRLSSSIFFNHRTSGEKNVPEINREPMKHPFLQIVDRLIGNHKGWSVFVPDCVFRNWISFFGAKDFVVSGADRSKHILSLETAYRSFGYTIGEFKRVDPANYYPKNRFDLVFLALYQAYYLDPQFYFSRMATLVAPGKYMFVGYWNLKGDLQRRINRAINPRFVTALNLDAMDKDKIMCWLPTFKVVDEGYWGGIGMFTINEPRDAEQRLILTRLQRELVFARRAFNVPSPEWSLFGYLMLRRTEQDVQ